MDTTLVNYTMLQFDIQATPNILKFKLHQDSMSCNSGLQFFSDYPQFNITASNPAITNRLCSKKKT